MTASRWLLGAAVVAGLAACAAPPPVAPAADASSARAASAAEMAGRAEALLGAARADVAAALGPATTVLRFDSGYEVWVYRFVEPAPRADGRSTRSRAAARPPDEVERRPSELVLLVTPAGAVAKTRVVPPP